MTAPSTVVTFKDKDGDLFPVRVWALAPPVSAIDERARETLGQLCAEPDGFNPTFPVEIVAREEF